MGEEEEEEMIHIRRREGETRVFVIMCRMEG